MLILLTFARFYRELQLHFLRISYSFDWLLWFYSFVTKSFQFTQMTTLFVLISFKSSSIAVRSTSVYFSINVFDFLTFSLSWNHFFFLSVIRPIICRYISDALLFLLHSIVEKQNRHRVELLLAKNKHKSITFVIYCRSDELDVSSFAFKRKSETKSGDFSLRCFQTSSTGEKLKCIVFRLQTVFDWRHYAIAA